MFTTDILFHSKNYKLNHNKLGKVEDNIITILVKKSKQFKHQIQ